MDINDLRALVTVLAFIAFIGIVGWAYSDRRKASYEEAARLPLEEEDDLSSGSGRSAGQSNT